MNDRAALPRLFALMTSHTYRGWRGYLLAAGSVCACVVLRSFLEPFGQFYYLPMVPAAVATALVSRRGPTVLAISLCVAVNVAGVPREGLTDTALNAGLFVVVSWLLAEICWLKRRVQRRALDLARDLAGSNAVLNTVFAAVPVVVLDRAGRIRRSTPAAAGLFGVEPQRMEGMDFARLVPGFALENHAGGSSSASPPPEQKAWRALRPDGRELALSLQLGITADPTGPDYAAVCVTDLTESQAAEARARHLDAQLNRVWRLNSLGEMSATLAHELNQPLSAAASYIHASGRDIERHGPLGQSAARTLELAKGQVLRAGSIIRRMRDLLATGTSNLRPERVSSMIEDLAPLLALLGGAASIRVEVDIESAHDRIAAERIQFQQAVINLVRNAIEAAETSAEPIVLIRGRRSGCAYVLSVEDNGPGVPESQLDTVLQPMITSKSSGMGLGLSVTRTIVEGHGGELQIDRSPFGGAAFSICLPIEEEAYEAPGLSLHH